MSSSLDTADAGGPSTEAKVNRGTEIAGRTALAVQGVLYLVVGVLALRVATGDRSEQASQSGAIETVARQPFGQVLLVVLAVGLAAHMIWRLALAIRGEPGNEDDAGSMVKRAANVGRALIYAGFTILAVRILLESGGGGGSSGSSGTSGGGGGGNQEEKATATAFDWPAGRWLVGAVGLAVIGAGAWNLYKAVTRKFLDNLRLSGRSETVERAVTVFGVAGYVARGVAFGLIGWFVVQAAVTYEANRSGGLDQALKELVDTSHGPLLLGLLAVGLFLFGAFRILDGQFRKESEVTHV